MGFYSGLNFSSGGVRPYAGYRFSFGRRGGYRGNPGRIHSDAQTDRLGDVTMTVWIGVSLLGGFIWALLVRDPSWGIGSFILGWIGLSLACMFLVLFVGFAALLALFTAPFAIIAALVFNPWWLFLAVPAAVALFFGPGFVEKRRARTPNTNYLSESPE